MANYEKKILNALIDSYENSLLSRGENKRNVRIAFSFTRKNIPEYFDISSTAYEDIHACVRELAGREFLSIVWKKGKKNHIVEKVLLNDKRISEVYAYLMRTPKMERADSVLALLSSIKKEYDTPVVTAFMEYLTERISQGKSVKEFADISDCRRTELLLRAIAEIERNTKECYIREFSVHHLKDSKLLEAMLGTIGKVFRRFEPLFAEAETEDILAEYSIYHTPNYVYVKGTGQIKLHAQADSESNIVDLEYLRQGIGLSGEDLEHAEIIAKPGTKRVITVENLTTFFRWQEQNSILIYLGGYHNSVRRKLLQKIKISLPEAEYLHFGDIDVGGFEIYEDLCAKTGIPFRTYRMGLEELRTFGKFGKKLTVNDKKRLKVLTERKRETECDYMEVLEYMARHDLKLEQECVE